MFTLPNDTSLTKRELSSKWRCGMSDVDACFLRADVNEFIRRFPDVYLSGMSGFRGHPRTCVALGVGSLRRITPKSGEGRCRFPLIAGLKRARLPKLLKLCSSASTPQDSIPNSPVPLSTSALPLAQTLPPKYRDAVCLSVHCFCKPSTINTQRLVTAGQALFYGLVRNGVRQIFGIPGVHTYAEPRAGTEESAHRTVRVMGAYFLMLSNARTESTSVGSSFTALS